MAQIFVAFSEKLNFKDIGLEQISIFSKSQFCRRLNGNFLEKVILHPHLTKNATNAWKLGHTFTWVKIAPTLLTALDTN